MRVVADLTDQFLTGISKIEGVTLYGPDASSRTKCSMRQTSPSMASVICPDASRPGAFAAAIAREAGLTRTHEHMLAPLFTVFCGEQGDTLG